MTTKTFDASGFTGTTRWFKHWTGCMTYTDGVQHLAANHGSYWLVDLVGSYYKKWKDAEFVVVVLKKQRKYWRVMGVDDIPSSKIYFSQKIEWSDFEQQTGLTEITLYLEKGEMWVLMLPAERS